MALGIAALLPVTAFAIEYDFTAANTTHTINGAIFSTNNIQSTGTGLIDPFLRLQGIGASEGLNSDSAANDLFADTKTGLWTHDIMVGDLGTTTIASVDYFTFLLDINQTGANPLLSLEILKFYSRSTSITDGSKDTLADLATAMLEYDLGANTLKLNYNLNPGSGSGDLWVYIPVSLFTGVPDSSFLYLHSGFGPGYPDNDGFQEWANVGSTRPPSVPDNGTTAILLGTGLIGLAVLAQRRRSTV